MQPEKRGFFGGLCGRDSRRRGGARAGSHPCARRRTAGVRFAQKSVPLSAAQTAIDVETDQQDHTTYYTTLSSGIRLYCRASQRKTAHLAFIFDIGSRDERAGEHGMAHYIEHCLFKGTRSRRSYHVLARLEDVGGEINAFTTKEDICLHGSFRPQYLGRAMELFTDIAFAAAYPEREIEKEKQVVCDEINAYLESPDELIFEQIEEMIFARNPLGRTILGTERTLRHFTREDILAFLRRNFAPERMMICFSGDVPPEQVRAEAERYLARYGGIFSRTTENRIRRTPRRYVPCTKEKTMDTHQCHAILAAPSFSVVDRHSTAMSLLSNLLGGVPMSARLNLSLRERHALVYSVEAFYTAYSDTGVSGVYFATDSDTLDRSVELVQKELRRVREEALGTLQLHRAKRQLCGQWAIASENELHTLLSAGKSYLQTGRADTFAQACARVEAVTAAELLEVANRVFDPRGLSMLVFRENE